MNDQQELGGANPETDTKAAEPTQPEVILPDSGPCSTYSGNLVIIGANGSGKSRLGAWIELCNANTHRISAEDK